MSDDLLLRIKLVTDGGQLKVLASDSTGQLHAMGTAGKQAGTDIANGSKTAESGVEGLAGIIKHTKTEIIGMVAAYAGIEAVMHGMHAVVDTVKEFQKLNAQLKTLTGSKEGAEAVFNQIQKFAIDTPYQLTDATQVWIMLKARGIDPTMESMRGIGNVAAAMGKGITEVTDSALQASVGNLETMRGMGFDVQVEGDKLRVTFDGVTKVIGKGAASLVEYFKEIGNTKFATAMSDQMKTLDGALSNVVDNAEKAANSISDESGLTGAMTKAANAAADWLGSIDAKNVVEDMKLVIEGLATVVAMRLTPALIDQGKLWVSQIAQMLAARQAAAEATQATLASARAEEVRTAALLKEALAQQAMAREVSLYGAQRAAIERQVTAATAAHTAATNALTVAQSRAAATAGLLSRAGSGLLTMLGGWPGLIVGGVAAIGMWIAGSKDAADSTDNWRDRIDQLVGSVDAIKSRQLDKEIADQVKRISEQETAVLRLHEQLRNDPYARVAGTSINKRVAADLMQQQTELDAMREGLEKLNAERKKMDTESTAGSKNAPGSADAIKSLDSLIEKMTQERETLGLSEQATIRYRVAHGDLAKQLAEAGSQQDEYRRKIIAASDALTLAKQREHDLNEEFDADIRAQEEMEKAFDKRMKANATAITELRQQLADAGLNDRDRFITITVRKLSSDATQSDKDTAAALAGQLYDQQHYADEVSRIEERLSAEQATLQAKRNAGLVTEVENRQQLIEMNSKAADDLQVQLATLEQRAAAGDQNAAIQAERLKARILELKTPINEVAQAIDQSFTNHLGTALSEMISRTKSAKDAFHDMAKSIVNDLIDIYAKRMALQLMGGSEAGTTGAAIMSMFGVHHDGGIAGQATQSKMVSPSAFDGAVRYHSGGIAGLSPDEVPAILQKGEEVITADDPRHRNNGGSSDKIIVQIIESKQNAGQVKQRQSDDGSQIIQVMVAQVKSSIAGDIRSGNGIISDALQQTYGLNRSPGGY